LLVVVTVIVVLLAMLAPALDQAVYQAELAVCAARQHGAVTGVLGYTTAYRRYYPHRAGPVEVNWVPPYLHSNDRDDRPAVFEAIQPKLLLDPFSGGIDLTTDSELRQVIYANYNMHFGWRYSPTGENGRHREREKGMFRLGDRFTWTDMSGDLPFQRSYSLLISDFDVIRDLIPADANATAQSALGGHPDRDEPTMVFVTSQDDVANATFYAGQGQTLTMSFWRNQNTASPRPKRGLYDAGFGYDDGSVARINDIRWNQRDERMTFVPEANNRPYNDIWGQQVPRN
jgi:hypothetical protein